MQTHRHTYTYTLLCTLTRRTHSQVCVCVCEEREHWDRVKELPCEIQQEIMSWLGAGLAAAGLYLHRYALLPSALQLATAGEAVCTARLCAQVRFTTVHLAARYGWRGCVHREAECTGTLYYRPPCSSLRQERLCTERLCAQRGCVHRYALLPGFACRSRLVSFSLPGCFPNSFLLCNLWQICGLICRTSDWLISERVNLVFCVCEGADAGGEAVCTERL